MFRIILVILLFLHGARNASDTGWDLSVNKAFYWPPSGGGIKCSSCESEVDSYWIDSWTADPEGFFWHTPEKYEFIKGDVISCVNYFVYCGEPGWEYKRYDGFYFCGESDPLNYIAYSWLEYPDPFWWGICISGIFYDTSIIPDRLLPLRIDWASKCLTTVGWFKAGVPLAGRPDCIIITKQGGMR